VKTCQSRRQRRTSLAQPFSGLAVAVGNMESDDLNLMPKSGMRDNDTKFTGQFDEVYKTSGAEFKPAVPLSPNLLAHVERFISLKQECLDKFMIVAERHLNYVCRQWRLHYDWERPHESPGHLPPGMEQPPETAATVRPDDVICSSRLGGLLKHYERRAAREVMSAAYAGRCRSRATR